MSLLDYSPGTMYDVQPEYDTYSQAEVYLQLESYYLSKIVDEQKPIFVAIEGSNSARSRRTAVNPSAQQI